MSDILIFGDKIGSFKRVDMFYGVQKTQPLVFTILLIHAAVHSSICHGKSISELKTCAKPGE